MYTCNNDFSDFLKNDNFQITIQPKQNFHFRYIKELETHSLGYLTGQLPLNKESNKKDDCYPTVKLLLPSNGHLDDHQNKRKFYVLCSLHNADVKCLSPHILLKNGEKIVNHELLFDEMQENDNDPLERFWELKKYGIVCLKKDEFKKAFESKCDMYCKLELPMHFEAIKGNVNLNDVKSVKTSASLNVCLGFTIFEKDSKDNNYRLYKETIFSNIIYHGDDITIHKLCNLNGSIHGNTEITILMNLSSKFPKSSILIKRINEETSETVWTKEIPIKKNNIFGQTAITFNLPPYDGPACSDDEILVYIQMVVTGTIYSNSVKFNYLNYTDDNRPRKKVRRNSSKEMQVGEVVSLAGGNDTHITLPAINPYDMHDFQYNRIENEMEHFVFDYSLLENNSATNNFGNELNEAIYINEAHNSNLNNSYISRDRIIWPLNNENIETKENHQIMKSPNVESKIKKKIDKILEKPEGEKDIDIMGLTIQAGNTIFHEALDIPNYFMQLYKTANKSPHKKLVLKARNKYRENLLHYSCKYNRSTYIRPLIGMGCRPNEQDTQGRTPLHTAMQFGYTDCILTIQQLLEDHSDYPKDVAENLSGMFKVYDHSGHTVLHTAIIDNRMELVEIMLKFCQKYNINIVEYEVLGNGDSLLHLLVKHNLIDMVKFIRRYISNYLTKENYSGISALDIPDISEEMLQALNV